MASGVIENVSTNGGSNYVKTPDGTLIQWGSGAVDLTVGANSSGVQAVSFPTSFINTTYVFVVNPVGTSIPAQRQACPAASGKAVNRINVQYQNNYSGDWIPYIAWIAIGKWK